MSVNRPTMLLLCALPFLLFLYRSSAACDPTWNVVNLHPDPWWESSAYAVSGSYQGGSVYDGGMSVLTQPAVWNGTADVVILGSARIGQVLGMAGADKVGFYGGRAALWKGPSSEYVELWPDFSIAYAAWNGWQAGSVSAGPAQASLWHGSADSRVALHPGGALSSVALAVDASGQAGNVHWAQEGGSHAALWQSTAESVVDLPPEGAYASRAQAISNGRQGGGVQFDRDGISHAALWSGTADSFFDLTPAGGPTIGGGILGMDGNVQVGGARFIDGTGGATVWFDTPESAFFLGGLLPSNYTESTATAVDIDEFGTIRVVGYAYNENYYLPNGTYYPRNEAMMWVLVPEPSSLFALAAGLAGLAGVRPRRRR